MSIIFIGLSGTVLFFVLSIFFFAFANRIVNIAINTQAINLQNLYRRKINGSFHGLWSLGGIAGVGFTTFMVALDVSIEKHFYIISAVLLAATVLPFGSLLKNDKSQTTTKLSWKTTDPKIIMLGVIALLGATCEGGMYDWSGVYFEEVIKADIFTTGYFVFMAFMTTSRLFSDWLIQHLGMLRMFSISAALIASGITLAVILPTYWAALIGFSCVGMGAASIIPMTFTLGGTLTKYSTGMAVSIISTFTMVGILLGPPIIGYIAHAAGLRGSFLFMTLAALLIIPMSKRYFSMCA